MSKITNQNYPNGLNPLSYMGVNAPTPGQQSVNLDRRPTPNDLQNFTKGTQWVAKVNGADEIWELVDLSGGVATWVQLYPAGGGAGGASEFITDDGTANEAGGVIEIRGDGDNISTEGSGNLINVVLNPDITVNDLTVESMGIGVVQANVAGFLYSSSGTDGQVLIGKNASPAIWSTLTAGTNITITNAPNSITINATGAGGGGIATLTADAGGSATDSSIKLQGDNVITTNAVSTSQVDIGLTNGANGQVIIGGGSTPPAWASILAGANITLTPGINSLTIAASGGGGGGGISTLTANTGGAATDPTIKLQGNNVITTDGVSTSEIDISLTNGTNGQVLIGGGGAPAWASISAGTNITLTPGANSLTIAATGTAPAAACAFLYYQPSNATNVTLVNVVYYLGQKVIMTSQYDNTGGAVTPGDGAGTAAKFTAPATGLYYLQFQATLGEVGITAFFPVATITITGNVATQNSYVNWNTGSIPTSNYRVNIQMSGMFPMTAGDIAIFGVSRIPGGSTGSSSDVWGTVNLNPQYPFLVSPSQVTYFSGYRVA